MDLTKSDSLRHQIYPSYLWFWKNKQEVAPKDGDDAIHDRRFEQGNEND